MERGGGIMWVCGHLIDDLSKIREKINFFFGGGVDSGVGHGGWFGWSPLWYVR